MSEAPAALRAEARVQSVTPRGGQVGPSKSRYVTQAIANSVIAAEADCRNSGRADFWLTLGRAVVVVERSGVERPAVTAHSRF
jgi:hypothetical protein